MPCEPHQMLIVPFSVCVCVCVCVFFFFLPLLVGRRTKLLVVRILRMRSSTCSNSAWVVFILPGTNEGIAVNIVLSFIFVKVQGTLEPYLGGRGGYPRRALPMAHSYSTANYATLVPRSFQSIWLYRICFRRLNCCSLCGACGFRSYYVARCVKSGYQRNYNACKGLLDFSSESM